MILVIRLARAGCKARDIREFSAFAGETEVLLLPNFKAFVVEERRYDSTYGMDVICLQEEGENDGQIIF